MNSDRNSYGNGSGGGGPGPIPNRWLLCPRTSESFIADKFLAFKTPLSARFSSQIPVERQFQPDMVFSYMKMYKVSANIPINSITFNASRSVLNTHLITLKHFFFCFLFN